jgi:hypothetical protein
MKTYYFGFLNWNLGRYCKEKATFVNDFLTVSEGGKTNNIRKDFSGSREGQSGRNSDSRLRNWRMRNFSSSREIKPFLRSCSSICISKSRVSATAVR